MFVLLLLDVACLLRFIDLMLLRVLILVLCLILSWLLFVKVFRVVVLVYVVLLVVVVCRCLFELLCFVCYGFLFVVWFVLL